VVRGFSPPTKRGAAPCPGPRPSLLDRREPHKLARCCFAIWSCPWTQRPTTSWSRCNTIHDEPLPAGLELAALQRLRAVVYASLQALDFTLDEATAIIGRLVEIDRRIATARVLPAFLGKG
jgi:hypothetical protein